MQDVVGVDFSGAASAGKTIWLARVTPDAGRLRLLSVDRLSTLAGHESREAALAYLCDLIRTSQQTLWAIDFPFGLPPELGLGDWPAQLEAVARWPGDAKSFGHDLLRRAKASAGHEHHEVTRAGHLRRRTDVEQKSPFDCYHYRIIYQTFHGMRDVLRPLRDAPATAVLPFQPGRLADASRVVVEACPSSTLKRLGLPHHRYKQPAGGPLEPVRRRTRGQILDGMASQIAVEARHRRLMMRDPGGDALDAVLAAVGGWNGLRAFVPRHADPAERYVREGMIFA